MLTLSNKVKKKIIELSEHIQYTETKHRYERSSLVLTLDNVLVYIYPDKVNKIFYLTILKHYGIKDDMKIYLPSELLDIVVMESKVKKSKDDKRLEILDELFIQASVYLWKIMKEKNRS